MNSNYDYTNPISSNAITACKEKIKIKENHMSIVCQSTHEEKPILLTGDIDANTMKEIAENNPTPNVPLSRSFYAIKAPHHGTHTHYFNFGAIVNFQYLLISNGETRKNRGQISAQYNLIYRNYEICCTNTEAKRCECREHPSVYQCCCCRSPAHQRIIGDI